MESFMPTAENNSSDKKSLIFLLGSCQYPPDIVRQRHAYKTLNQIKKYVSGNYSSRLKNEIVAIITGDSIYADATAGLFDPVEEVSRYQNAYIAFNNAPQKKALDRSSINFLFTIDDHEIEENWEPPDPEDLMLDGKRHFLLGHQRGAGLKLPAGVDISDHLKNTETLPLWRVEKRQNTSLFLMDTRTEREHRRLNNTSTAKLISNEQKQALFQWLDFMHAQDIDHPELAAEPKFIVSGSMLLPRQQFVAQAPDDISVCLNSDAWDGYPATMNEVLAYIARNNIKNVVFLSGDAHIPCFAEAELHCGDSCEKTIVYSIHAAPFHAPFPFGNGIKENYAEVDSFKIKIENSETIQLKTELDVRIQSEFPEIGNGFISFQIPEQNDKRLLTFNFIGDAGESTHEIQLQ